MKELIFSLSTSEYIKIISGHGHDIDKISLCCDMIKLYFVYDDYQICIGQESVSEIFEPFIICLKKAIEGKLQLHESISQNLGLMQNRYYQDKTGFFKVPASNNSSSYWVGLDYQICTTFGDANPLVSAWMYNDNYNNIIFEFTKDYPWHFLALDDKPSESEFIPFDEFIKDFKPLVRRIIPHCIALEWLNQALKFHRSFYESEESYQKAYKRLQW
ncbi:hypothetical protein [Candidatus Chromulinivorax destructor]|uniref:Uncharacterized protein n=1 Tax=Candidatus Chromulinivorax destructor TaxID=2066483 RepID=A0A345ZBM8_9BACT|nr:hypothetical protein [Candidatus Chromulinivorax destructor]AXK60695.1 hypothetical protein C0J27_02985 [Candidatus Chromulinivorax destructor]